MGKISRYDAVGDDDKSSASRKKQKTSTSSFGSAAAAAPKGNQKSPAAGANAAAAPLSSKSASNKLRDVRRAMVKLEKQRAKEGGEGGEKKGEQVVDEAHLAALQQKVALLERRKAHNAREEKAKSTIKKQSTRNRKATFMETRKVNKLLKKADTDLDKEKYIEYLEYIKRFNAHASGKLKYISLFDTKLSEEDAKKREEFLDKARLALEARAAERDAAAEQDGFFAKQEKEDSEEEKDSSEEEEED